MTHLPGNHTITSENAHEYANVTSIGGSAEIYATLPLLTTVRGIAYIQAPCPALTSIGHYAYIQAPCPALTSIGRYAYIEAPCPALTSIGGGAYIQAPCPALTSIQGKPVSSPEDQIAFRAKVAAAILANPALVNLHDWHEETECGIAHCLAGWAQFLAGPEWSEDAGVYPSTAGACLLGPSVAPLFYRVDEPEAVLAEIKTWVKPQEVRVWQKKEITE
jgi:hypothetical protein